MYSLVLVPSTARKRLDNSIILTPVTVEFTGWLLVFFDRHWLWRKTSGKTIAILKNGKINLKIEIEFIVEKINDQMFRQQ